MPNYYLTSADNVANLYLGGISGSPDVWVSANGFSMLTTAGTDNSLTLMGKSTIAFNNSSITNLVGGHGIVSYGDLFATIGAGSTIYAGTGVSSYPGTTLKLRNAGSIEGKNYGVAGDILDIENSGTIIGRGETAISGSGASRIANSGTISGNSIFGRAINLGDESDLLDNSGTINGYVYMGDGANYFFNTGKVTGGVSFGDDSDFVINEGYLYYLSLGGGNDLYYGVGNASAIVEGGAGNDTFFIGGTPADDIVLYEEANGGTDTLMSTSTRDLADFTNFENIELQGSARVNAFGNGVANRLEGFGNSNANLLRGFAGNDTYAVDLKDIVDEATSGAGTDTVIVSVGSTVNYSLLDASKIKGTVENLTIETDNEAATGTLTGNALGNVITVVQTSAKNVKMTLKGLAGNDIYVVDKLQIVDESAAGSNGIDRVRVKETYSLSDTAKVKGSVEQIEWIGSSAATVTGTLTGNGLGNALIVIGATKITLRGLAGNDVYTVGANAIVDEAFAGSNGTDTIVSAFTVDLGNTAKVKGTVENVTLTGTSAVNAIAANNTVANKLTGNIKANVLDGKAGADKFVFNTAYGSGNVDTVKGFTHALDEIQLDGAIFKGLGTAVEAAEFRKGAGIVTAANADQHLIYNTTNGALYWDFDGNKAGGVAAVQIAILTDKPALDHTDFAIV